MQELFKWNFINYTYEELEKKTFGNTIIWNLISFYDAPAKYRTGKQYMTQSTKLQFHNKCDFSYVRNWCVFGVFFIQL